MELDGLLVLNRCSPFTIAWKPRDGCAQVLIVCADDAEELRVRRLLDRCPRITGRWEKSVYFGMARGMPIVMLAAEIAGEIVRAEMIELIQKFESYRLAVQ